ncbi:MAG TPA: HNH endonuclease [Pyrinomonadaceae bacterium]|jgi:hypothetical protein|nr:HNH endonuclease [Pyrinomonadaceae bacterium]
MNLYYHHVGKTGANEDFKKTVFSRVAISVVKDNVADSNPHKQEMLKQLKANFPSGTFNCWGAPVGAKDYMNTLEIGDAVLLVESAGKDGRVPALCQVVGFWRDEFRDLSQALWGADKFPYIFFFETERLNLTWQEMLQHVGYGSKYNPRGNFLRVADSKLDTFGGAERYIEYLRANFAESDDQLSSLSVDEVQKEVGKTNTAYVSKVKKEQSLIKQKSLDNTPRLREGAVKQVKKVVERPRSAAFRISVKKLYQYKCTICGFGLLAPDGQSAVDSAHIYPKELDGSDDFRNGICLCRLHHWAFDSGWMSIADDYIVLVRDDLPTAKEYDFIRNYAGQEIHLPQQVEFAPHSVFLRAHRKLKGFEP